MTTSTEGLGNPSLTAQDPRFGPLTIALGYADPKAASVLKGVLDSLGCRGITLVRNGPELLAKTVAEPIDIAVIDWTLRASSGPEAVRRLRFHTSHPRRDLPVIWLCSDESEECRRLARDAGADATMSKPFTPRGPLSAVYRVIEGCFGLSESQGRTRRPAGQKVYLLTEFTKRERTCTLLVTKGG
jgi:CheY-like chemotaxis protein